MSGFSIVHTTVVNNTNAGTLTATVTLGASSTLGDLFYSALYYGGGNVTGITDNFGSHYGLISVGSGLYSPFGYMAGSGTATLTITGSATANTTFAMVLSEYNRPSNIVILATNDAFTQTAKTVVVAGTFQALQPAVAVGYISCFAAMNTSTVTAYTISATVGTPTARGTAVQGAVSLAVMDIINNTNTSVGVAPFVMTNVPCNGTATSGTNTSTQAWSNLSLAGFTIPPGITQTAPWSGGFDG